MPMWPGPSITTTSPGSTGCTQVTAQLNGSKMVSSSAGQIVAEAEHRRAGQQLEVLGEPAVETRALVDREVVAVDPEALRA